MSAVTVIMSVYRESIEYFSEAVYSILNQDFEDFDFIIINDNPKEQKYRDWISKANNNKIRYYDNEKNIGLALTMNRAAKLSDSDYIARMDADDFAHRDRLSVEYEIIRKHNADIVYCPAVVFDDKRGDYEKTEYYPEDCLGNILPFWNPLIHSSVLMKRSKFLEIGGYNNYMAAQDYDLWLRMYAFGFVFKGTDQCLLHRRDQENSITSSRACIQTLSRRYIAKQYFHFLKNGQYLFSEDDYQSYLRRCNAFDEQKSKKVNKGIHDLDHMRKLHSPIKILGKAWVYLWNPFLMEDPIMKRIHRFMLEVYR